MPDNTSRTGDLRDLLTDALTREHYRRARARIEASPEGHSAAMADVAVAALAAYADADVDERIAAAVSSAVPDGAILTERDIVAAVKAAIAPDLAELQRLRAAASRMVAALDTEETDHA